MPELLLQNPPIKRLVSPQIPGYPWLGAPAVHKSIHHTGSICRPKDEYDHRLFQSTFMRPATMRSGTKLSSLIAGPLLVHM